MSIPLFFAMTEQEIASAPHPERIAWMSCHFSAVNHGLAHIPSNFPSGVMLILDDRIPFRSHDESYICTQLQDLVQRFQCTHLLLDFQRHATAPLQQLVKRLERQLPCPIAAPPEYAQKLDCPVFLPPIPPLLPAEEYLKPFGHREIWLELALDGAKGTVTTEGCRFTAIPHPQPHISGHFSRDLGCHYHIEVQPEEIRFSFYRTREDALSLLDKAGQFGVTLAVGLYQEFGEL